jgi:hypothetical protein
MPLLPDRLQEFSVFAFVSVMADFFMQVTFFTTVLSIDIRRMELTDLHLRRREVSVARAHSALFVQWPTRRYLQQ